MVLETGKICRKCSKAEYILTYMIGVYHGSGSTVANFPVLYCPHCQHYAEPTFSGSIHIGKFLNRAYKHYAPKPNYEIYSTSMNNHTPYIPDGWW